MASTGYLGARTYQPSVNGSETMPGPELWADFTLLPGSLWRAGDNLVKTAGRDGHCDQGTAFRWDPGEFGPAAIRQALSDSPGL